MFRKKVSGIKLLLLKSVISFVTRHLYSEIFAVTWVRCHQIPDLVHKASISRDMLVVMHINAVEIQTMNHFK